jgi:hypothetical protein
MLDHVQTSQDRVTYLATNYSTTRVASCPLQRQVLLSQRPPSRDSRQQKLSNSSPTHLPQASNPSFRHRRRPRARAGHRLKPAFPPPRPAKIGLWSIFCSCSMTTNRWYVAFEADVALLPTHEKRFLTKSRIITFNVSALIVRTLACEFHAASHTHTHMSQSWRELVENGFSPWRRRNSSPTSLRMHISMLGLGLTLRVGVLAQISLEPRGWVFNCSLVSCP